MDRKTITFVMMLVIVLLLSNKLIDHYYPPVKIPVSTNQLAQAALAGASNGAAGTAALYEAPGTHYEVRNEVPEQLLMVTNAVAKYTFTSRGGGLQVAELTKYPQNVSAVRRRQQATNEVATLNTVAAPPVLALVGDPALQDDGVFTLSRTADGVRAQKLLTNGLTLTKDFHLGSNYLMAVSVQLRNGSGAAVTVPAQNWVAGTATPMNPIDNGSAEQVMWYNGAKAQSVGLAYFNTNTSTLGIIPRTVQTEYGGTNNVVWASTQNQFFALATMPDSNNPAMSVTVRMVPLPAPSQDEIAASRRTVRNPQGLETLVGYPAVILKPGESVEANFHVFAGPKEYYRLRDLSDDLNNHIDLVMGFGGWFGPISKGLLVTMNWLHSSVGLGYGMIVVIITVILRMIFWPLTRASTRSMKRMQELQPQMKALQEKYKDDPAKQQQKIWEFYKKNKVNPLGGCLPMLLQIPVFFGFLGMLRNAIELRGAHFLWIGDLSQPDTIFTIPGFNFPINLMPLFMAGAQFWQASLTPASPAMDPAQQKMMRYMPLVMVFVFYNYSSGLALYWCVSTLLTVLQTKLTKTNTPVAATAPVPARVPQRKK
jgi:YidC/Oxa1 family membrane protein insertase